MSTENEQQIDRFLDGFDKVPCVLHPQNVCPRKECPIFYESAAQLVLKAYRGDTTVKQMAGEIIKAANKLTNSEIDQIKEILRSDGVNVDACLNDKS